MGAPGAWGRVFTHPNLAKFEQPTVHGVDFPRLGIAAAWNDTTVGFACADICRDELRPRCADVVSGVAAAGRHGRGDALRRRRLPAVAGGSGPDTIEIDVDIDDHDLEIFWITAPGGPGPPRNGEPMSYHRFDTTRSKRRHRTGRRWRPG